MISPTILHFISKHRISVLSVVMPDSTVHSATLHYSFQANPFTIFFNTKKKSKKCQSLLNGKKSHASLVIGFSEEEFIELQLNGTVEIVKDVVIKIAKTTHFTKYPDYQKYENDPERVFLAFKPSWYRYTEFRAEPKILIEGKI